MPGGGDGSQNMTTGRKRHFGSHVHHHHILAIENGVEFVRRNQHRMHGGSPDFRSFSILSSRAWERFASPRGNAASPVHSFMLPSGHAGARQQKRQAPRD